jgi:membrane protease YdiL (CAAX protease family)
MRCNNRDRNSNTEFTPWFERAQPLTSHGGIPNAHPPVDSMVPAFHLGPSAAPGMPPMSSDAERIDEPPRLDELEVIEPIDLKDEIDYAPGEQKRSPNPYWGPWATLGWTVLLIGMTLLGQIIGLIGYAIVQPKAVLGADAAAIQNNGNLVAVSATIGMIPAVALIVILVLVRGCSLRDYLALTWPSLGRVALSIVGLLVLIATGDTISYVLGRPIVPEVMVQVFKTGWMPLLLFAVVVAAPIGEELMFRGFIYKGIAASRWGPIAAIVFTSIVWASIHVQYDLHGIIVIAACGIYLGWVRHASASVPLTILLHAINNLVSSIETYYLS